MDFKLLSKKFNTIFLLIIVLTLSSFSLRAQQVNFDFKETNFKSALKEISTKTGYNFVYSESLISQQKSVTFTYQGDIEPIKILLDAFLKGTNISFDIKNKQIALSVKNNSSQVKQNKRSVSGVVKDKNGETVPGASIRNKSKNISAGADENGHYTIEAGNGDILAFSYIGMIPFEVVVGNSNIVNAALKEDMITLDNVVVTGYQTLSKERATGSFTIVSSKELEKYNSIDISSKLESSANGVYVDPNGNIQIRGISTIRTGNGKTDPLIVVDGFPIEGDLSSVNPNDVDKITILRDAAAASIYGIKSANGVIVITRKSSKKNKLNISGNVSFATSNKPSLSYLNIMEAKDAVDYQWEAYEKGIYTSTLKQNLGIYTELGKAYLLEQKGDIQASQEIKNRLSSYGDLALKQYQNELYRRTSTGQYGIVISGGSNNADYYVSGRINDYNSMLKGNNNTNVFLDTRVNVPLSKNITLSISTTNNYSKGTSNSPVNGSTYYNIIPFEPLRVDGELNALTPYSISLNKRDLAKSLGLLANGIDYNLINELNYSDNTTKSQYNRYQAGLTYKWDKGLKVDLKFQYEDGNNSNKTISSPQTYIGASFINDYASYDGTTVTYNLDRDKSKLTDNNSKWNSWIGKGVISYEKSFAKDHYISALAGMELQSKTTESTYASYGQYDKITGATIPSIANEGSFTNWAGSVVGPSGSMFMNYSQYKNFLRSFSCFSNLGYTFKGKYNLTGSFRIDQSNIFATDSKYRYKPMWSAGLSWNVSKEKFLSNINWINNLTLRATYGLTGMIDKTASPYVVIVKRKYNIVGNMAEFLGAPNPDLRWEQTKNLNIGLDFSLLKNRLYGYVEYYNKYSTGVISPSMNDPTNGFSTISANVGEISNKGIDININSLNIDKQFKWLTSFNFSTNKNKVEKIYISGVMSANSFVSGYYYNQYIEGYATDELFSYKWAGLDSKGYSQVYDKKGNIVSASKSSTLTTDDLVSDGRSTPQYFGNLTNTFTYQNLTLTANITYKFGYSTRGNSYDSNYRGGFQKIHTQRWQKEGDETTTNVPGIHYGLDYSASYATYSTNNTINAAHVRLKFISLSYMIPQKYLDKICIKNLSVNFQAENLGIIWRANSLGIDPDFQTTSGRRTTIPALATYTLGLKITL